MKNTANSGSLFRKKGFFIALYSCLGIVAVLAMVITVANRQQNYTGMDAAYEQDASPVGADQVDSYMAGFDEEAWFRPRQTESVTEATAPPASRPTTPVYVPDETLPTEPTTAPPATEPAPTEPPPQVLSFEPFANYHRMFWPLYGETVMPFSITSLIYDPTLDQFRTNDNIRISAEEGTPVRAGADGIVIAVGSNVRQGNYVTIDHGNGWVSTYGQLMEEVLVGRGELVLAGQIIGGVGQPSIFGSGHGTHLHLRIKQDDMPINPYYVLEERTPRD